MVSIFRALNAKTYFKIKDEDYLLCCIFVRCGKEKGRSALSVDGKNKTWTRVARARFVSECSIAKHKKPY
jgi:predicted metal-binding protein